jgi:hypothetical protein
MSSSEEKRETGSALMILGWIFVLFAFLVMFFFPAGVKLGQTRFQMIAGVLVIVGLAMSLLGTRIRRQNR